MSKIKIDKKPWKEWTTPLVGFVPILNMFRDEESQRRMDGGTRSVRHHKYKELGRS
jgi:hypothetical protein